MINCKFYKIQLLQNWLRQTQKNKTVLFDELVVNASDQCRFEQIFSQLQYLIEIENKVVAKINNFQSDDINDFDIDIFCVY